MIEFYVLIEGFAHIFTRTSLSLISVQTLKGTGSKL